MSYILTEKKDFVCTLTINRPESLNALNTDVLKALEKAVDDADGDEAVRVVVITGAGRAFVAGADIEEMADLGMGEGRAFGKTGQRLFRRIEKMEKPTIASVNGFALGGGCELALSCDMRIASDQAVFGQPEVGLGITPGFSGTQRLPRRIGTAKAKEMIFTGRMIDAYEADRIGLINKIAEPGKLMDEAKALAESCIKNAPVALRYAKACIDRGMQTDIDTGISIENELFAMCFATEDQKEGMKAFLEKRKPVFNDN